ncbi:ATPase/histidine kinase/DNA gyrase B/HSP90 domain protein [[Clostridium] hylemonae DSM 15053]|uniref:Circadian input-output histidine kinase CikA n=2 Tax=[Clostridium] hylemonae TaxID=89153 RepID=C0BZQ4_9FIRM|nr:PAS domain-containing sensor histidine kinase [[Clostridium] hylemonae]EEG74632.1 ATPase/histidine kinase/DNA gyrase B/HSP90 domain protein [[Clostridium] hylemonae DSM 15053]QEK18655.1 Sensory/regulatory protein RpfC [[Clostridium] hylemonae DSM 15053]
MENKNMSENKTEKAGQTSSYDHDTQYFQMMMEEYDGNIYISDIETYDLLYLNQTACRSLDRHLEEIIGCKCYKVIQGRNDPCPFCTNDKLREDEYYEWEFYNPVLERTFMIKDRLINWNGRMARMELSHDMYTSKFKLEKKSREQDALLRSVPGGFARLDARDCSTVLWYGADFLGMIGYTAKQFEQELDSQCSYLHPDDLQRIIPILHELETSGGSAVTEAQVITRSGETKILTITLSYASGEESWDGIPSFYTIGIDITKERMEQERQRKMLEDAYKTARIASEAKTNFLSSMSHDIRTPMNAIMGMTAIAEANLYTPDKLKDCLSKINASAQHLLGLINEVLDMSKIESGKIDLTFGTVSLPELFQNISDMCRPLAQEKNQKLQLSVDDVCHKTVITDGGRLQQVLMNLLTNAIKYTPEGGAISLHVREIPSDAVYKGQYEFIVTDNGIGMTAEYIPHIFEPFSRAEDTRINKIQGTGLGLAITQNIVNMMNGTIEVQSEPENGSRFIVAVPLDLYREDMTTSAQLKSQSVTPDEEAARLVEEEPPSSLSGRRILLVEDNDLNREIASELLEMHGCSIEAAENGKLAVEKFARSAPEEYDCILMDIQMPVMDGYEAARAIRALKRDDARTVPILALTANAFATDLAKAHNAGMNDHIAKPIDVERLLETLNRWMV